MVGFCLRGVRHQGNKTSVSSLSFPLYSCQVDRLEPRAIGFVILLICYLFTIVRADGQIAPRAPAGLVWECPIADGSLYYTEVEALLKLYETEVGEVLAPGERGQVGLKINTRSGRGLSTPLGLIRATVKALEARGYDRNAILIIDDSSHTLRQAGVMPPLSIAGARFEGSPVVALDSGIHFDPNWFYDSPLPPALQQESQWMSDSRRSIQLEEGAGARKSFLPRPLIFDVDFWINLAVGVDDPALGVDGALANATLWNVSNSRRFLVNQATASAAVAEIAAIPELEERLILNFVSLERYQFIAGPFFNSIYTRSEPRLWMSSDPVALDRLLYDRMNAMRLLEGFPEIAPLPRQLPFAASLGLGEFEPERIRIQGVELDPDTVRTAPRTDRAPWLIPDPPQEAPTFLN
jgi:hypothetical protein